MFLSSRQASCSNYRQQRPNLFLKNSLKSVKSAEDTSLYAVKSQFRDMMSPSISGSTIGQVLVKFLNFKHVNNHMIRHSVEQK